MFDDDDDIFSFYNSFNSGSTTTETEQETDTNTGYNTSSYKGYQQSQNTGFVDDYSMKQNYEDERSYQPMQTTSQFQSQTEKVQRNMDTPLIQKEEKAVTLTKTRQRVNLNARMKIMIAMFSVIMSALVFVIAWNFISAAKINSNSAEKIQTIASLESSINSLTTTYNVLSDDAEIMRKADELGYEKSDESNTFYVSIDELPSEPTVEPLPSNWFNDVCEFFSKLFA